MNMQGNEEEIRREIVADAERKAQGILSKAEREAKKEVEKARADAERLLETARAQAQGRARQERESLESILAAELRRLKLARGERLIERVFERTLEGVEGEDEGSRRGMLERLTASALEKMEGTQFTLEVSARDFGLLDTGFQQELSRRLGRAFELTVKDAGGIAGGVRLTDADGRQIYDNTLHARLERMASALRLAVAPVLFDKGAGNE